MLTLISSFVRVNSEYRVDYGSMTFELTGAKSRNLDLVAAISLANLCLLLVWRELIYADPSDRYFTIEFSPPQYVAALLNLAWLSAVFYLGVRAFRRATSVWARIVLVGALGIALTAPLNYIRLLFKFQERQLFALVEHRALLFVVLVGVGVLALAVLRFWRISLTALYILLIALAPFAAMNVIRSAWAAITTSPVHAAAAQRLASSEYSGRRVVCLIFDELDWRLVFEHPPATLKIPAFRRLMEQSIVSAARETSNATLSAIPALTTGQMVRDARGVDSRHNVLSVSGQSDRTWQAMPNVFSDAHSRGARTAIVGFYHPYCRIFAGQYDSCVALPHDAAHLDPKESIPTTMLAELARLTPIGRRIAAVRVYKSLLAHTTAAAGNPAVDFLFAHVSVPHGPNIWEPNEHRFDYLRLQRDAYFDNVVLADNFLAAVRSEMERAGLWDQTLVLVTSDHGWRHTDLIGEKRDRHIPLLIKAPDQHSRIDIEATLAASSARAVIRAAFRGGPRDPAELVLLLDRVVQPSIASSSRPRTAN